ncbi:MAG: HAD-IG family 5'-nucleotidase [Deltaproteobacteria bacterium]|nr:HAD-IG family 5'-nucleotidase [Deltaproteobacteria bacterium]
MHDGPSELPPHTAGAPSHDALATADLEARVELDIEATALDPTRRIFVNRNLRLEQIRQIGFDMDYTLAPYVKRNLEALSFQLTAERMVKVLGYPEDILNLPYDKSFVVRGLVVDKRFGNIFKMDSHGHVGRVYHGRDKLSKEERRALYRSAKVRLAATRYHWVDTLFALPEAALFAEIIELYEKVLKVKKMAYWKLFDDIRSSIDLCHRDGSLKAIIKADMPRYIEADPELPQTLHKLRSAGKRLFVLTNSEWDYTDAVMSYMLDGRLAEYPSWRNYFDLILVGAQKPRFFREHHTFDRVDPHTGKVVATEVTRLEHRGVYRGGSIKELERLSPPSGDQVLYVGDHIYGDIIRSKRDSLWRTLLILEELEGELHLAQDMRRTQADLEALEEHRGLLDHDIVALKLKLQAVETSLEAHPGAERVHEARRALRQLLDRKRRNLRAVVQRRDFLSQQVDRAYNPYWGSTFKEGSDLSRFGEQVEDYACLYTSRVSNLLSYSPTQYFRAPRHWMAHEKA